MVKEKKRGFFSWSGFGQKGQTPEKKAEVQNGQPVVEEITQARESVRASEHAAEEQPQAYTEAETEAFAVSVVEITEQAVESEKAQPETEVAAQPESVIEKMPEPMTIEREELSLPGDVNAEAVSPEEQQAETETVEIVGVVEGEAVKEEIIDEEPGTQALVTEMAEEAAAVAFPVEEEQLVEEIAREQEKPTGEGFFARLKCNLLRTKENFGSGFISLFCGKKIGDDLFEKLEEQLSIVGVGVETTHKIITNLTEGASRKQLRDVEALYGLLKGEMSEILTKVDGSLNVEDKTPFVILTVNVNGMGKTAMTGKLTRQSKQQGKSVALTTDSIFRATAVE